MQEKCTSFLLPTEYFLEESFFLFWLGRLSGSSLHISHSGQLNIDEAIVGFLFA